MGDLVLRVCFCFTCTQNLSYSVSISGCSRLVLAVPGGRDAALAACTGGQDGEDEDLHGHHGLALSLW